MPLTPEELQEYASLLADRGKDLHDPAIASLFDSYFVENEPDPEAAAENRIALNRAYAASRITRTRQTRSELAGMDPTVGGLFDVDPRTGAARLLADMPTYRAAVQRSSRVYEAGKAAEEAGTLERLGRGALAGFTKAGSGVFDWSLGGFNPAKWMGGEARERFEETAPAFMEKSGISGQIGYGVGALVPIIATRGRGVAGFAWRSALFTEEGSRLQGAISGALAGGAAHIGTHVVGRFLASRITPGIVSRLGADNLARALDLADRSANARFARYLMGSAVPGVSNLAGEYMTFGVLSAGEQFYHTGAVDLNVVLGVNAGIIGMMKLYGLARVPFKGFPAAENVRKAQESIFEARVKGEQPSKAFADLAGASYKNLPVELEMGRIIAERRTLPETPKGPEAPPEGPKLLGPGGPSNAEVAVAQHYADLGIVIPPEVARLVATDPAKALEILVAENPVLGTQRFLEQATLEAKAMQEKGLVVDLKPVPEIAGVEAKLPLPEAEAAVSDVGRLAQSAAMKGDMTGANKLLALREELAGRGGRPTALLGLRARLIYLADRAGAEAQRLHGTKEGENQLKLAEKYLAMARQNSMTYREFLQKQAKELRDVAQELPLDDPARGVLEGHATALEARSSPDPLLSARLSQAKGFESLGVMAEKLERRAGEISRGTAGDVEVLGGIDTKGEPAVPKEGIGAGLMRKKGKFLSRAESEATRQTVADQLYAQAGELRKLAVEGAAERQKLERIEDQMLLQDPRFVVALDAKAYEEMKAMPELGVKLRPARGPTPEEILLRLQEAQGRADQRIVRETPGAPQNPLDGPTEPGEMPKDGKVRAAAEPPDLPEELLKADREAFLKLKPAERRAVEKYLKDLQTWLQGDRKGKRPQTPLHKKRLKTFNAMVRAAYREAYSDREMADDAAANIAGPRSAAARIFRLGEPEVVAATIRILHEKASALHPMVEAALAGRKEGGFLYIGPPKARKQGKEFDPALAYAERVTEARRLEDAATAVGDTIDGITDGGGSGPTVPGKMPGNGAEFFGPGIFGRIRNQVFVAGRMIRAAWTGHLQSAMYAAHNTSRLLPELAKEWWFHNFESPAERYFKGKPKEFKEKFLSDLLLARHAGTPEGLDAQGIELWNVAKRGYAMWRDPLSAMGVELLPEESYVPFFREVAGSERIFPDAGHRRKNMVEIDSMFTKERISQDPDGVLTDFTRVWEVYTASIGRKVAYDPLIDTMERIFDHYGVEGDRSRPGRKGLPRIPAKQHEWWLRQRDIWAGRAGPVSKALEDFAGASFKYTAGRVLPEKYHPTGRQLVGGWTQALHMGMLGGNIGSAIKQFASMVNTVGLNGLKYTLVGISRMNLRNPDGTYSLHPLIERLRIMDSTFARSNAAQLEDDLMGFHGWRGAKARWRDLSDGLMFLFRNVELFVRASAGIGAYEKALVEYRKAGVTDRAELDRLAFLHAEKAVDLTQVNYSKDLSGQIFSGSAGRLLGQYSRYGVGYVDFIRTITARAFGSKTARAEMPLLPGENAFMPLVRFIGAAYTLTWFGQNVMGISIDDWEGPGGGTPEAVKFLGSKGLELGARGLAAVGVGSEFENLTVAREVAKSTGLKPQSNRGGLETFFATLGGPTGGAISSTAEYLAHPDDRTKNAFVRTLVNLIPGGLQGSRVARYFSEEDGKVRSSVTGELLFPVEDRPMTRFERYVRLVGLESAEQDREMDALDDVKWVDSYWKDGMERINNEGSRRLRDGASQDEVAGFAAAAYVELAEATGKIMPVADVANRVRALLRREAKKETTPRRTRLERAGPFRFEDVPR